VNLGRISVWSAAAVAVGLLVAVSVAGPSSATADDPLASIAIGDAPAAVPSDPAAAPASSQPSVSPDPAPLADVAGPADAGPTTAGPSTAGPSTAGPTTAGPSTAGPSTEGPTAAAPADAPPAARPWGRALSWRNAAQLDNHKDGRNRSRVAFSVENGSGDRLTAENQAVAHADCSRCRTVALAFQVGIFTGRAPSVSASNASLALNESCDACVTFAAAQQFLLVTDRPLRFTRAGQWRLAAVRTALRRLAASPATDAQLQRALADLEAEVVDVLTSETRLAHRHALLRFRETDCDRLGRRHELVRVRPVA
jgi:hypothetical protein